MFSVCLFFFNEFREFCLFLLLLGEFVADVCSQQFSRFSFQMDLMPFINKAGCECLNESDEHGFDNCLRKDSTYLESDCDEQVH